MNCLVCFLVGGIATGIVLNAIYLPSQERLKTDLTANITEIKSTQSNLNECNLKVTGMLMNK